MHTEFSSVASSPRSSQLFCVTRCMNLSTTLVRAPPHHAPTLSGLCIDFVTLSTIDIHSSYRRSRKIRRYLIFAGRLGGEN